MYISDEEYAELVKIKEKYNALTESRRRAVKKYADNHKEEMKEYYKKWRKENLGYMAEYYRNRRKNKLDK